MWAKRAGAIAQHVHGGGSAAAASESLDDLAAMLETELAASAAEFRTHGVAFIPGLISPAALELMRAALQEERASIAQQPDASGGEAGGAAGSSTGWRSPGYIDAPGLLERSDECLAMLENPRLVGLVQAAVGTDAHLINLQAAALGGPTGAAAAAATQAARPQFR
eukprot:COSAG06_NODE_19239_length_847_cov_1.295455_1_plen_165_part_10